MVFLTNGVLWLLVNFTQETGVLKRRLHGKHLACYINEMSILYQDILYVIVFQSTDIKDPI